MTVEWLYYVWATLLVLANAAALVMTVFTLPGNWIIVGLTALFAFALPWEDGRGIHWTVVTVVVVLAVIGEVVEFAAGAAGAAKQGASRRAMALAIVGAIAGSLAGAVIGVPIPVIGPLISAIGGGALGAFGGAYLGELWKGKTADESLSTSAGALLGRLFGTVGKLMIGAIIFVIVMINAFF